MSEPSNNARRKAEQQLENLEKGNDQAVIESLNTPSDEAVLQAVEQQQIEDAAMVEFERAVLSRPGGVFTGFDRASRPAGGHSLFFEFAQYVSINSLQEAEFISYGPEAPYRLVWVPENDNNVADSQYRDWVSTEGYQPIPASLIRDSLVFGRDAVLLFLPRDKSSARTFRAKGTTPPDVAFPLPPVLKDKIGMLRKPVEGRGGYLWLGKKRLYAIPTEWAQEQEKVRDSMTNKPNSWHKDSKTDPEAAKKRGQVFAEPDAGDGAPISIDIDEMIKRDIV